MRRKNKDSVLGKPLNINQKYLFSKGFIPKYIEIELPKGQENAVKNIIIENIGKRALIKDNHHGENCYEGGINFDKEYPDLYFLVNKDEKEERIMRFHVHDLERLLIRNPFFKLPDA